MSKLRSTFRSYVLLVSPVLRACPALMIGVLTLQLIGATSLAVTPFGFRLLVDAVPKHDGGQLVLGAVLAAVTYMASMVLMPIAAGSSFVILERTNLYLVVRIAELVNRLPGIDHLERPEFQREIDLLNRNRMVLAGAPQQLGIFLPRVITLAIVIFLLAKVDAIFLILPIVGLVPYFADGYSARYRRRVDDRLIEPLRLTNELFSLSATASPAKELRVFGLGTALLERHRQHAAEVNAGISKASRVAFWMGSIGWLAFAGSFVTAIAVLVVRAAHGQVTVGEVVMAVLLVSGLQFQVGSVVAGAGQFLTARITATRLVWLEEHAKENAKPTAEATVPDSIRDGIDFDHVTFTYPGAEVPVLRDISFHLPAGTSVAIVGENGAGKTTLVKLLSRMYEPTAGTISLDGTRITALDIDEWRRRIAAIFQDFGRYELTAGETVGVGDLPRLGDDEAIMEALEKTGSRDVIDGLDEGLATLLGKSFEGGRDLSGGQWQKLALGRGRMRQDPLLLILDEPTASLDAPTEHAVFEQYVAAAHEAAHTLGTITVLISHRFSTVRMADLIIVLDDGKVLEVGSHADLLSTGGLYAELFALQQRSYQ